MTHINLHFYKIEYVGLNPDQEQCIKCENKNHINK